MVVCIDVVSTSFLNAFDAVRVTTGIVAYGISGKLEEGMWRANLHGSCVVVAYSSQHHVVTDVMFKGGCGLSGGSVGHLMP